MHVASTHGTPSLASLPKEPVLYPRNLLTGLFQLQSGTGLPPNQGNQGIQGKPGNFIFNQGKM